MKVKCVIVCCLLFSKLSWAQFDIQGHRGARGLYPENSIHGFIEALKLGVNTLELDVVITKDSQVVLSHEPWLNAAICAPLESENKMQYNIFKMTYTELQQYDCGSKGNPKFPTQQKIVSHKPLLKDVFEAVENYAHQNKLPLPYYNIETKSTPNGDNVFHPEPEIFMELVYTVIKESNLLDRTIIQSFDTRTLIALKQMNCFLPQALLVFNGKGTKHNLKRLAYLPAIYSPNYLLVNKRSVKFCHQRGIKIIPWTVNDTKKMEKMKALGCDGLITDYPDIAIQILR
jgi:glycerophosphoryl diester phosphodiesterase